MLRFNIVLLGVSALSSAWVKAEDPCGAGFQLVWEEDFVGSALNTSRWTVANNFTHHDGPVTLELFMNDECYLENGVLVMKLPFWPGARDPLDTARNALSSRPAGNLVLRTRRRSVVNRHGIQMNYTSCAYLWIPERESGAGRCCAVGTTWVIW